MPPIALHLHIVSSCENSYLVKQLCMIFEIACSYLLPVSKLPNEQLAVAKS